MQAAVASSASLTSCSIRWARLRARHVKKVAVFSVPMVFSVPTRGPSRGHLSRVRTAILRVCVAET